MTVDPQSAAGSHEHVGIKYHFCSTNCLTKFKADPDKYLKPAESHPPAPVHAGAQYTCPMHPEIVKDAPGSCPICGMALVPIAGTGEADDSELRDLTRRFWIGTVLSIPLVILAMAPMIGIDEPFGLAPRARGWVEFALGTPVVLWVGWPILHKFWLSLTHRALNMYTLIGLGVGACLPLQPCCGVPARACSRRSFARTTAQSAPISRLLRSSSPSCCWAMFFSCARWDAPARR